MAIKKHKLEVQVTGGGESPSSFIVDLRQDEGRLESANRQYASDNSQLDRNINQAPSTDNQKSEIHNANANQGLVSDFQGLHSGQQAERQEIAKELSKHINDKLVIPALKASKRSLGWLKDGIRADRDDFKELLLYPVLQTAYRLVKTVWVILYMPFKFLFKRIAQPSARHFKKFLRFSAKVLEFIAFIPEYLGRKAFYGFRRLFHKRGWRERWRSKWQKLRHDRLVKHLHGINYYRKSLAEDFKREQLAVIYAQRRPRSRWRRILGFAILLLLLILPFKALVYYRLINTDNFRDRLTYQAADAWNNILSAGTAATQRRFSDASLSFAAAGNDFLQVKEELRQVDELLFGLASISNDPKLRLASASQDIATAGEAASNLGQHMSLAFDGLFSTSTDKQWGPMLDRFVVAGNLAVADSQRLNRSLAKIRPESVPAAYQERFDALKKQSLLIESGLGNFMDLAASLKDFLGVSQTKRYLLVFQNNNEMRASGGFLGSYALVDLKDGKIKNLEVPAGGTYDTEAGLRVLVKAPAPLWLVNPLWHFWDANWWADWPTSARNLMWFYEHSDGPTVDGVISVTPTVLEKLLAVTGPIDMTKDHGVVITADNFWETTQTIVETIGNPAFYASSTPATSTATVVKKKAASKKKAIIKPDETATSTDATSTVAIDHRQPKKIIGDLFSRILEILPQQLNQENLPKLLQAAESSLSEKQVMFYFTDEELQKKVEARGWAGKQADTPVDYLSVIHTNIAGGKSDREMSEIISHKIEAETDGSLVDTLRIVRTHNGIKGQLFTGVRNVDWLRVYVPAGSQLLSASGFKVPDAKYFEEPNPNWDDNKLVAATEGRAVTDPATGVKVYQELGKTVFADWVMVDPGETIQVEFKYRLPFRLGDLAYRRSLEPVGPWWQSLWYNVLERLGGEHPRLSYYSLLVQKQPGAKPSAINISFSDKGQVWKPVWNYPESIGSEADWKDSGLLDRDQLWMRMYVKK